MRTSFPARMILTLIDFIYLYFKQFKAILETMDNYIFIFPRKNKNLKMTLCITIVS